jgi:hypothetical protein
MERLDADVDQERVEFWRVDQVAAARTRGEDDDLTEQVNAQFIDRRDRAVVAYYWDPEAESGQDPELGEIIKGAWRPSHLKRDDDVICGGIPLRVVGPARDRGFFLGLYPPWFGDSVMACEALSITDRAPANAGEPPMPVIPGINDPNVPP